MRELHKENYTVEIKLAPEFVSFMGILVPMQFEFMHHQVHTQAMDNQRADGKRKTEQYFQQWSHYNPFDLQNVTQRSIAASLNLAKG